MSKNKIKNIDYPVIRLFGLCLGLIIMAFGIAFSIKADLGTSPISSLPYVTSELFGVSVGTTTIIMNFCFVLLQIIILRRQYEWFQLFQLPATVLFGTVIDLAESILEPFTCSGYFQQWLFCAAGIILVALGVSVEIKANLITTAGEGIVLAVCKVAPIKFGNMKVIFDVTLVCISVVLALVFLGRLSGVREGTIVAAILIGQITKIFSRLLSNLPFGLQTAEAE